MFQDNRKRDHKNNAVGKWTDFESQKLHDAITRFGEKKWTQVSEYLLEVHNIHRQPTQCRHRWHKTMLPNLKKGHWDEDETQQLRTLVMQQKEIALAGATIDWEAISKHIQGRTGKACRERWTSRMDPSINREPFSAQEEEQLLSLHAQLGGNQWARIADQMSGRTADAVKSKYISIKRRRAREAGEEGRAVEIDTLYPDLASRKRKELAADLEFSGSPSKRHSPVAVAVCHPIKTEDAPPSLSLISQATIFKSEVTEEACVTDMVCPTFDSLEVHDLNMDCSDRPREARKPSHSLDLGEESWVDTVYSMSSMSPMAMVRSATTTPVNPQDFSFLSMLQGKAIEPLLLSDDAQIRNIRP